MSVKKQIYLEVSEKISELKETEQETSPSMYKTIDLWRGQVGTNANKKDATVFPASFISVSNIAWQDMTMNTQEGSVKVGVYLFFNRYGDTFHGAEDQLDSLQILDAVQETVDQIQWLYKEKFFTELTQISEQDLTERYNRPAYLLTFEAECYNKLKLPNYVHN